MNRKFFKATCILSILALLTLTPAFSFAEVVSDGFQEIDYKAASSLRAEEASTTPTSYRTELMGAHPETANLPNIRTQQPHNVCWAFSLIGNAEINLIKNGYASKDGIDLSEAHLAYFMYHRADDPLSNTAGDTFTLKNSAEQSTYLAQGGNILSATFMLSGYTGLVNESVMPYAEISNNTSFTESDAKKMAFENNSYVMENAYYLDTTSVAQIKEAIYKFGSVSAGYLENSSGYNFGNNTYYYPANTSNHAIVLVGWDDSVSKSYFNNSPTHDGAWIVRNSWGNNRSYFYLSYDQYLSNAISCTYVPATTYSNNYHYDGGSSDTKKTIKSKKSAGNIYKAKANSDGHELLQAVNIGFASTDADYKVEIYTDVVDAAENPTKGTLAATCTGTTTYAGLYTIRLDTPVVLKEGTNYSIVVTNNSSKEMSLFTDRNQYEDNLYYKNEVSTSSWQSYAQDVFGFWEDGGSVSPGYTVRIKGLTTNSDHDLEAQNFVPASLTADGNTGSSVCSECGETTGTEAVIPKIDASTIKVEGTSFEYSGESLTPSVVVKDRTGKELTEDTDYTLTYNNNLNVGTATVNITFKGNYTGSSSCNFTITSPKSDPEDDPEEPKIRPRGTRLSSIKAGKKSLKVSWKKQTSQIGGARIEGYQIQYSPYPNFSSSKIVTVSKYTSKSKKINKLSRKKKYYVRVRTYMRSSDTYVYSYWSSAMSKKTK